MDRHGVIVLGAVLMGLTAVPAAAQTAGQPSVHWEVANRFRLFAEEKDFTNQVKAYRALTQKSVLEQEHALSKAHARGWAENLGALCYDTLRGRVLETCKRDGVEETYLNLLSARLNVSVDLPAEFSGATCTWTAEWTAKGEHVRKEEQGACKDGAHKLRASTSVPTKLRVEASAPGKAPLSAEQQIKVRDVFIVGMGDSIASGEGNPMKPVRLDSEGFCFERVDNAGKFYRPGRADVVLMKDCAADADPDTLRGRWDAAAAGWLFPSCHRSLYGYQSRAALQLAIENPDITVTYLPLGCTGATIKEGILGSKQAREILRQGNRVASPVVEAQTAELKHYLQAVTVGGRHRAIDLLFLTIGANDIGFSELVANVMVTQNPERNALKLAKLLASPQEAQDAVSRVLRPGFAGLRSNLRSVLGGNLGRVVMTTYGNPARYEGGKACPSTRTGFDVHPAFSLDGAALAETVKFVDSKFLPELKAMATCSSGGGCSNAAADRMTFVDTHASSFADHGFCAVDANDPPFDKKCLRDGDSFRDGTGALKDPIACDPNLHFAPYAARARWIRTANDSYLTALTYPYGGNSEPTDIHDGAWGLRAAVYGGALHPTAQGHAAMADAALVVARKLLGLSQPGEQASTNAHQ